MSDPAMPTEPAGRILKATLAALAVAVLVTVLVIWPAWFGIGPTVRSTAVTGAPADDAAAAVEDELAAIMAGNIRPAEPGLQKAYPQAFRSEVVRIPLDPSQEVEFKAHMSPGDTLVYSWKSSQPLYVDMHGEPYTYPEDPAVRYEEIDGASSGHGRLTAAFSGMHGWFWLNTSDQAVEIELEVSGFYDKLEEVYRSAP